MSDLTRVLGQERELRPDGEPVHYFFFGVAPDDQKSLWKVADHPGAISATHLKMTSREK
jgi:hypothetical protein